MLKRVTALSLPARGKMGLDPETLKVAGDILADVENHGEAAVRRYAERFGELSSTDPLLLGPEALAAAREELPKEDRDVLERVAERVRFFAAAQKETLSALDVAIEGGRAGHSWSPMERAGCYAPGGRFPLPSSVLMTAVTARVAGVEHVLVASPRPTAVTLAAASVAGADGLLAVGGAHAIGALAYGAGPFDAVDVIVGPGSRWVTAAKKLVSGQVAIDMIAGPSELVVLADGYADASTIAADLLAQAEHDDDAIPILVSDSPALIDAVEQELATQLETLPTADTARNALANGYAVRTHSVDEGVAVCDTLAPEHLQVMTADAEQVAGQLRHYGGLFVGSVSAEVFGDYGAGPNHVLPTGGTARLTGGLSVVDFMRVRTWLNVDRAAAETLAADSAHLARLEGLEAHARAAEARKR